jgi:hypothetical protein
MPAASFQPLFGSDRRRLLLRRVIEDGRTVLGADVGPLAVERRWVVDLPEDVEQFVVGNLQGIVFDLDDFRMPGAIGAYVTFPAIAFEIGLEESL